MKCLRNGCDARLNCTDSRADPDGTTRRIYKCPKCGEKEYTTEVRRPQYAYGTKLTLDELDFKKRLIEMVKNFE